MLSYNVAWGPKVGATGMPVRLHPRAGGKAFSSLLPREHGVWFMWLVPTLLGAAAGGFRWMHVLVLAGALWLHLASYAALEWVRSSGREKRLVGFAAGFAAAGAAAMLVPVLKFPALLVVGALGGLLFLGNVWFARRRQERALVNDLLAIAGLQLWAPVSYAVATGRLGSAAWQLWLLSTLFFAGSAIHVKTLFRERANRMLKWASRAVHLGLLVAPAAVGLPDASLAYAPAAVRAWAIPGGARLRPIVAGVIEIANSLLFLVIMALLWQRAGL